MPIFNIDSVRCHALKVSCVLVYIEH